MMMYVSAFIFGYFLLMVGFVVFLLFAKNNCSREVMMCRMTMLNCS